MTDQPRYSVGDAVRIATRMPIGHYRTPGYVRGKAAIPAPDDQATAVAPASGG